MAAQAGASLSRLVASRQPGNFPEIRPSRACTLYAISAHLRALAAREPDYHRRRLLEKRSRACQRAAREALRSTLDGGRACG